MLVDTRPLRTSPAFRRLWIGGTLSGLGSQLAIVAVLYQAWTLTHSALAVGAIGIARAVPMVLLGIVGGSLADAVDRRRLVLLTTAGQLVTAVLLAVQALAASASWQLVLGLVALQAAAGALGAPARRAFPARLLDAGQVAAGVALTHLAFQAALLVGPALGGLIIGRWGVGACYLLDAVSFAAALQGVRGLPPMRPVGDTVPVHVGTAWAAWRFVGRTPVLGGAFLTDVLATVLARPTALFPAINAERFGGQPQTLGLFLSAIAAGGLTAGAMSGIVARLGRPGAVMLAAAGVWGLCLVGFGVAQQIWLAVVCLAIAGAADTLSVISRGAIVQLATPDRYRGRVGAVEHIVGVAGPDIGNFRGGFVAGVTSASFAVVAGGLACALGVAALAVWNTPLRRFGESRTEHIAGFAG